MNQFNLLEFLSGLFEDEFLNKAFLLGVVTSTFAAVVMYGRKVVTFIYSRIERLIVFSVRIEQTDDLFWVFERWLYKNHKKQYRRVIAYLHKMPDEIPPPKIKGAETIFPNSINFRQEDDYILIKHKRSWIRVFKGREKMESAKDLFNVYFDSFTLKSLFGSRAIKSLIDETIKQEILYKKTEKVNYLFMFNGFHDYRRSGKITAKNIDRIFLPDKKKDAVVKDVERFLNNKDWYTRRGILYKRGYLLYGPPGNGKTSLALSMAKYLQRDIYSLSLQSIRDDSGLLAAFMEVSDNAILLLEDIDTIIKRDRELKSKVNFSTLLNCLDGAFYHEGLITIMTTNRKEVLDEALIRPGRMDMSILIDMPDMLTMKDFVNDFYETQIYSNGDKLRPMSMAELQNICLKHNATTIKDQLL